MRIIVYASHCKAEGDGKVYVFVGEVDEEVETIMHELDYKQ